MKKNILVTGAQGYIGTVLLPKLNKKYNVFAYDAGYFKNCLLEKYQDPVKVKNLKLKDFKLHSFKNIYAVIHLGAISNDPSGKLNPKLTLDTNFKQTVRIAKLAKKAGVKRFLFSSSCIMYGSRTSKKVSEKSPLKPNTVYAKSKVLAENKLRSMADENFSPIYIRNGTVYGYSPRMRFDTVLNDFILQYYLNKKIKILSKGTQYRPVVHVDDVANSFLSYLEAPYNKIHNQSFNNGNDKSNFQIKDLAKFVVGKNDFLLEILNISGHDNRSYIASFKKLNKILPKIKFNRNHKKEVEKILNIFKRKKLKTGLLKSGKFIRMRWLERIIKRQNLNS